MSFSGAATLQAYYINLARRPDRREYMEQQLAGLGIQAQRVEAMLPEEITDADRVKGYPWLDDRGIIAGLSHIRALKAFLRSGDALALILEDDAVFSRRVPEFLDLADSGAFAADIVRIETGRHDQLLVGDPITVGDGFDLCKSFTWVGGCGAYIVTRKAAEVLASGPWLRQWYSDVALFDFTQPLAKRLKILQLIPGLTIQLSRYDRTSAVATSDLGGFAARSTVKSVIRQVGTSLTREVYGKAIQMWQQRVRGARKRAVPFLAE